MSRDGPSKLYQRGRFGFAPRLGGDKEGFRKGPGDRPLPPLLRSCPGSGRETGKEKGREAAASAEPPSTSLSRVFPDGAGAGIGVFPSREVEMGGSLPRGCGGVRSAPRGVPARQWQLEGSAAGTGLWGAPEKGAKLCPLKTHQIFSRARVSCQPRSSAPHDTGKGEQDSI